MSILRGNLLRNMGKPWLDWYDSLPAYEPDMAVWCPHRNSDGTLIDAEDIPGCRSDQVVWSGDCYYDCLACGIFFSDFAANPPHRRSEEVGT